MCAQSDLWVMSKGNEATFVSSFLLYIMDSRENWAETDVSFQIRQSPIEKLEEVCNQLTSPSTACTDPLVGPVQIVHHPWSPWSYYEYYQTSTISPHLDNMTSTTNEEDAKPTSTTNNQRRCRCAHCVSCVRGQRGAAKTYPCPFPGCRRVYKKANQLRCHLKAHVDDRRHVCQWLHCGKRFVRADELQRHIRIHTGEKPFSCSLCRKAFGRSDHLAKHIKTHQREMPLRIPQNWALFGPISLSIAFHILCYLNLIHSNSMGWSNC